MAEKQVDRDAEAQGSASGKNKKKTAVPIGRRIQVRRSGVHGKGVFALQAIPEGETVIEYVGEIITWKQADKRGPSDPNDENHTFFFSIMDGDRVIDANVGGNASRWINHSCDPNCESDEDDESHRVFIKALRNIKAGEELNYDYGLVIDEPYTKALKDQYKCLCGAKNCRGTMLAPKGGASSKAAKAKTGAGAKSAKGAKGVKGAKSK